MTEGERMDDGEQAVCRGCGKAIVWEHGCWNSEDDGYACPAVAEGDDVHVPVDGARHQVSSDDFDRIVEQIDNPNAGKEVEVIEVLEPAGMVEITVPVGGDFPHPEVTLFATIADYLSKTERRAVIVVNCTYELRRGYGAPVLIGTVILTQPTG